MDIQAKLVVHAQGARYTKKKSFLCNMVSNLLDQDTQRASHIMDTPWQCDDSVLQTVTYYYMDLTRDLL